MKQLKFLMIAFTLLMSISLTSCMESDPTVTGTTFGRVIESFPRTVIDTPSGVKFYAENDMTGQNLYSGDYIYFQYSYNSDLIEDNAKDIDATIVVGETIKEKSVILASDKGEIYENATVIRMGDGIDPNYSEGLKFIYYDKNRLLAPVVFLHKGDITGHNFELVYNIEETKSDDKDIVFYLRHRSSDSKPDKLGLSFRMFDIEMALEEFVGITGKSPENVVIYTNESLDSTSDSLDKKKDDLTKYSVRYLFEK